MSNAHTPGPWVVHGPSPIGKNPNVGLWSVEGDTNVANHCTFADANLIAAAPDMLEALKGIEHFSDAIAFREDTLSKALREWINAGRAAIAKAEQSA